MPDTPSSKLPALFVRLPVATHDLLRDLAAAADESVSRYVVTLIEQQRVGGPQLPPRHPRGRERVEVMPPVEVASDEPVKRKRGRPRKVPLADAVIVATPPRKRRARVPLEAAPAIEAAPVEEPLEQPVVAAPTSSRTDTLDRIRAALARLEEPPVEELPVVAGESRVVVEDAP
jgi:hypothetical protein